MGAAAAGRGGIGIGAEVDAGRADRGGGGGGGPFGGGGIVGRLCANAPIVPLASAVIALLSLTRLAREASASDNRCAKTVLVTGPAGACGFRILLDDGGVDDDVDDAEKESDPPPWEGDEDKGEVRMNRLISSRTSSSHRLSPIPSLAKITISFAFTGTVNR